MGKADGRIPVLLRTGPAPDDAGPETALLFDADRPAGEDDAPGGERAAALTRVVAFRAPAGHGSGCACCAALSPLGRALALLFVERARGGVPFFRRVVLVSDVAGWAAARAALAADPIAGSRFRLAD